MKKERKYLYEGMYIINSTLSEEARKRALDKITNGIIERGGEIHKIHDQGRRRLAYEIGGKREGFYYLLYFSLPSLKHKDLIKDYHLHEDLLRFMTLQTDKVLETIEFKPLKTFER
jgi:small subunit ribosomal protein S6